MNSMDTRRAARLQKAEDRAQMVAEESAIVVTSRKIGGKRRLVFHQVAPVGTETLCGVPALGWETFREDARANPQRVCLRCVSRSSLTVQGIVDAFNEARG